MKTPVIIATVMPAILIAQQALPAQDPNISPGFAAAQARIDEEDTLVGRAIATHDFAVLDKFWSPLLIVNSPANKIESRSQVIDSMHHGVLNYTSLKGTTEFFTVTNGVAIKMMHEDVVMANGPMAGKHLVRRTTNILQPSGDDWVLIARQATYIGFDGAILTGPATTTYAPPTPTPESAAIRAQIDENGSAVGHAIRTKDFAALQKLWSPDLVVNSPGNNILTRAQVFAVGVATVERLAGHRTVGHDNLFVAHLDNKIPRGDKGVRVDFAARVFKLIFARRRTHRSAWLGLCTQQSSGGDRRSVANHARRDEGARNLRHERVSSIGLQGCRARGR